MRVSTQQLFGRGIESINDVNAQLQKTQLQMSANKKVLTPADDPVASTRILQLNQELALNDQYQRNINTVENNLKFEDGILGSINDVIQRVRELTINAGNGALNGDDLKFISAEIKERLGQLAGMMNSQDASGEFMFGGFQGKEEPFQQNISGSYTYKGDEGRRFIQIEASVNIAATENGKSVFMDLPAAKNTFYTEVGAANQASPPAIITTGQVIDQEAYDAFYPEDMVIKFKNSLTGLQYDIIESSSGKVLSPDVVYVSGAPITAEGVQFEIVGEPLAGDSFFVQSTAKQGTLTTVEKLIYGLDHFNPTSEGRDVFDALLEDTLTNLDSAETSILETRSHIGARLNTVDSTREQHLDIEVLTKEVLSDLQDLDYAEAISNLSMQQFILESAYSTFSKVTSLSLFDRL
ncbi:flagellar hook-associated protein FlgL [Alkalimarinus alittae]|uniref:Flagellar hook-associated protein FlgL n=1 Tax=Alkalimarinus alittae TaxID=2961619 RepID=A0ABY6N6D7_9ALTE|nr:flagellar hook-associated protein FlgL [Alkalimarinus alittae]UZE97691.1 flagellar hook-associated protein FlgL [Alkalimarinus alittae]